MDLAFTGLSPPRELILLLRAAHLGGDGLDRRTGRGVGEMAAEEFAAAITHHRPPRQP